MTYKKDVIVVTSDWAINAFYKWKIMFVEYDNNIKTLLCVLNCRQRVDAPSLALLSCDS